MICPTPEDVHRRRPFQWLCERCVYMPHQQRKTEECVTQQLISSTCIRTITYTCTTIENDLQISCVMSRTTVKSRMCIKVQWTPMYGSPQSQDHHPPLTGIPVLRIILYYTFKVRIDHLTIESTLTGPIGGLNCEVLLYFNWSHRWSQL